MRTFRCKIEFIINHSSCTVSLYNDVCISSFTLMLKRAASIWILSCVVGGCSLFGVCGIRYVDELRSMDDAIKHGFLNATIVWPGLYFRCVCKFYNIWVRAFACFWLIGAWACERSTMPFATFSIAFSTETEILNFGRPIISTYLKWCYNRRYQFICECSVGALFRPKWCQYVLHPQ